MPLLARDCTAMDSSTPPNKHDSEQGSEHDVEVRLHSLHVYPIKSCAGITLEEALLIETGLEFDRAWMVVDLQGRFVTQRELPRMREGSAGKLGNGFSSGRLRCRIPLDQSKQGRDVILFDR